MAISRVGLVTLATGTTTGWTCAIPAGVQDNDVLFVVLAKSANGAPTPPAGYTLLDPRDDNGGTGAVYLWHYARTLTAADGGTNHVWTWASVRAGAAGLLLRGVDPAQVLDVTDPPNAGTAISGTTVTAPASTVATAGDWVLWSSGAGTNVTHAFPATSGGNAVTREVGSVAGAVGLAWATYPAAGAVAALPVTVGATGRSMAKTLVPRAGIAWESATAQRWTGSAWTPATVQRWDGGAWVPATPRRRG